MTTQGRHAYGKAVSTTVPKMRIYVERPEEPDNWLMSVRHVAFRGAWKAEPHAHPNHGQVIFVRSGQGVMNLEGRSVPFEGPCILLLPTECVHGLDYEIDVDRWLMTIEVSYLTQVNSKLREFAQLWTLPRMIPLTGTADSEAEVLCLFRKLEHEVKNNPVGHVVGTEALLTTLLLMLVRSTRLYQVGSEGTTRHDTRLVERFRELIEQHYAENMSLQNYASAMAVSLVQLRAACASAAGQSPTKIIHARLITEAKRNLIFGDMSVEQIAFSLGFADAAYFTRFFRKEVNQVPSQFRAEARQQG
jgi:AraC family transcriptional activator of pobA